MPGLCGVCGVEATKSCAKCRAVSYCGRECQKIDWPQHRRLCGAQKTVRIAGIDKTLLLKELCQIAPMVATVMGKWQPFSGWDQEAAETAVRGPIEVFLKRFIYCDLSGDSADPVTFDLTAGEGAFLNAAELAFLTTAQKRYPDGEEDEVDVIRLLKHHAGQQFKPIFSLRAMSEIPRGAQNTRIGFLKAAHEYPLIMVHRTIVSALSKFTNKENNAAFVPWDDKEFGNSVTARVVYMYMW